MVPQKNITKKGGERGERVETTQTKTRTTWPTRWQSAVTRDGFHKTKNDPLVENPSTPIRGTYPTRRTEGCRPERSGERKKGSLVRKMEKHRCRCEIRSSWAVQSLNRPVGYTRGRGSSHSQSSPKQNPKRLPDSEVRTEQKNLKFDQMQMAGKGSTSGREREEREERADWVDEIAGQNYTLVKAKKSVWMPTYDSRTLDNKLCVRVRY